jgi:repressor LexA
MLTAKQKDLLLFIHQHTRQHGVSPSFDEMKEALDLASKSGIHRLVSALEERGFIRRLTHRARALEVIKLPDQVGPKTKPAPFAAISNDNDSEFRVPLLGRIAAGTPIDAIQHEVDRIRVPDAMIGKGDHFALEVRGDSMVEAGILNGDIVIIRRGDTALDGDVVVALVDREEATLKTLRRRRGMIALEPANSAYSIQEYAPERVDVQGKLVGLVRRYD